MQIRRPNDMFMVFKDIALWKDFPNLTSRPECSGMAIHCNTKTIGQARLYPITLPILSLSLSHYSDLHWSHTRAFHGTSGKFLSPPFLLQRGCARLATALYLCARAHVGYKPYEYVWNKRVCQGRAFPMRFMPYGYVSKFYPRIT